MSDLATFAVGQPVRVKALFTVKDSNGVGQPTDPTGIVFTVCDPNGVRTQLIYPGSAFIQTDGTGSFYVDVSTPTAGEWWYRWESSGAVTSATEDSFYIERSNVLEPS